MREGKTDNMAWVSAWLVWLAAKMNGPSMARSRPKPSQVQSSELQRPLQQHQAALGERTGPFDQWVVKSSLDVFGGGVGGWVTHLL